MLLQPSLSISLLPPSLSLHWNWHPADVKSRTERGPVDLTETRLVWKKAGSVQQAADGQLKGSQWPVKLRPEHP